MNQYVIGLDNGGTVTKAALFDLAGREIAVASGQTRMITPKPGYTERDMDVLWQVNCDCLRRVLADSGVSADEIAGVAVCGHGKGLYPWGNDGRPAGNGIVSTDNRAWREAQQWKDDGTFDALYPQLCQQLLPCQQAAILAWMKTHERARYDAIRWVFSVKDYIRFRLTGEAYSEATDISGSGLMDVRGARFDRDLLEKLGIGEVFDKLAPIRYSSDMCGAITEEAAALTGLKAGTPVAGGMFDIDACAIAMDVTDPELLCTVSGTWSINEFISETPVTGTAIAMNSLFAIPGYYLLEECSATSAGNLDWALENLAGDLGLEGKALYRQVDERVSAIAPEDSEVYYLPFLYGSNAHPLAKACFLGLTTYHSRDHMLRAVFEGVAFSHRSHIDKLLSVRSTPKAIRLAGGVANSPVWVQMFADVLGCPIETVQGVRELGALGAAMAAAVAGGVYPGYREAAKAMVRINAAVPTDPLRQKIYAEKYARYKALRDALDPVWGMFGV